MGPITRICRAVSASIIPPLRGVAAHRAGGASNACDSTHDARASSCARDERSLARPARYRTRYFTPGAAHRHPSKGWTCLIGSALGLVFVTGPAHAKSLGTSPLALYVQARVADRVDPPNAVDRYREALAAAPDVAGVAYRSYRRAVVAGDYAMAVRAAGSLERGGLLPPDARLLLYVAALRERDWKQARERLTGIGRQQGFDFIAPLLGNWLSLAEGQEAGKLAGKGDSATGNAYAGESDALMRIAKGDAGGTTAIKSLWSTDPYRANSLRLAAAATLAKRNRVAAVDLLSGDDPSIVAARALLARGGTLRLAVDSPASGAAFLLARMAGDLIEERSAPSAVMLARFATFADPANPRVALIAAGALSASGMHARALALVDPLRDDPVYDESAASLRIELLEALGQVDRAIAEASARAGASTNDLARLADIEARRGNHAAAATHYRAILGTPGEHGWATWFALGNALNTGGDWAGARPALERALALAPEQAILLNELGYGLVEHGQELARATALLERAHAIQPQSAAIADSLGWAMFRQGDTTRAVALLETAQRLDGSEGEIAEHLGDVYWARGRRIEARHAWRAARVVAEGAAVARLDARLDRGLP